MIIYSYRLNGNARRKETLVDTANQASQVVVNKVKY